MLQSSRPASRKTATLGANAHRLAQRIDDRRYYLLWLSSCTGRPTEEPEDDSLLVMVIEKFKGGQAAQVYMRLRKRGRMLPEGVRYVSSWVDMEFTRCFQLMECADTAHLTPWIEQWADLVDFELVPVRTGSDAFAIAADWESIRHLASPFKPRQWTRQHAGVAAEHVIQADESWFDAAISMPGEPMRLVGGAPSRKGAESIAKHQLNALEHWKCTTACEHEWTVTGSE